MELAVPLYCPVTVGFCGSYSLSNFLSSTSWLSCTNPGLSLGFIQKNRTYPSHLKRWDSVQIGSLVYCCRRKETHSYRGWNCAGYSTIFDTWRPTKDGRVWYAVLKVIFACKKRGFWRDTGLFTYILLTLRRRIKSHLLFAGIIRSSPFSPR